mmetsp:Transcript_23733/g.26323  ORF Transcript_23733/g.26323 Transcript_23733/m.26323 type:complete len:285 (-) Transcript_23733:1679-2533(-)
MHSNIESCHSLYLLIINVLFFVVHIVCGFVWYFKHKRQRTSRTRNVVDDIEGSPLESLKLGDDEDSIDLVSPVAVPEETEDHLQQILKTDESLVWAHASGSRVYRNGWILFFISLSLVICGIITCSLILSLFVFHNPENLSTDMPFMGITLTFVFTGIPFFIIAAINLSGRPGTDKVVALTTKRLISLNSRKETVSESYTYLNNIVSSSCKEGKDGIGELHMHVNVASIKEKRMVANVPCVKELRNLLERYRVRAEWTDDDSDESLITEEDIDLITENDALILN